MTGKAGREKSRAQRSVYKHNAATALWMQGWGVLPGVCSNLGHPPFRSGQGHGEDGLFQNSDPGQHFSKKSQEMLKSSVKQKKTQKQIPI